MRFTVVAVLAGLIALALARPNSFQISEKQQLERQRQVLRLFRYVNQPSYYQDQIEIAQQFNFQENYEKYTKPEVAREFYQLYQYGLLPRGQVFSVFYEEQLQQAIALFRVFYYAQDYETFYRTAVWARQNVNEGLYLYALSVAIVHRPDTYGIVLPPIYEVYPYYFFSNEVIQQAYRYKQQSQGQQQQEGQQQGYTINANYSGYYLNLNPEQSLSYFTEDIGLNAFYYYYNIFYPYWLGGEEFNYQNTRRGEQYYYVYQQILARYYLERLSNGFGEIPLFNYEVPFETGYYPSLQYPNGLQFPTRPNYANLYEYFTNYGQRYGGSSAYAFSYTLVQDYERRIRDAIDRGFVYTDDGEKVSLRSREGINILGNLIQSNPDSPNGRYYGDLQVYARHLLGYSYTPLNRNQVAPSALEHFETSLRDPAFYQFYKRIVLYFQKYQRNIPAYTQEDLSFQGVEVTNVEFDRLVTYFDYFYADLSNAVYVTPEQFQKDHVQIRVRQQRLNNKPFTYRVFVNSEKEQEAVVRVYIGPKYDEYGRELNISQNRINYVQFDHFRYQLKSGENVISRNSREVYGYIDDRTSYRQLYQQILGVAGGNGEFNVNVNDIYYGIPRRFLLPRGDYGGVEYQFYVIVSPYEPYQRQQGEPRQEENNQYPFPRVGSGAQFIDNYPLGYPFDRPTRYDQVLVNITNAYVYSARIYHRQESDINASTATQE